VSLALAVVGITLLLTSSRVTTIADPTREMSSPVSSLAGVAPATGIKLSSIKARVRGLGLGLG
jgi:hypothetical protein